MCLIAKCTLGDEEMQIWSLGMDSNKESMDRGTKIPYHAAGHFLQTSHGSHKIQLVMTLLKYSNIRVIIHWFRKEKKKSNPKIFFAFLAPNKM